MQVLLREMFEKSIKEISNDSDKPNQSCGFFSERSKSFIHAAFLFCVGLLCRSYL